MQSDKERITKREFNEMNLPKYVYDKDGHGFKVIWKWHKDGCVSFVSYRLDKTTLSDQNWAIQAARSCEIGGE